MLRAEHAFFYCQSPASSTDIIADCRRLQDFPYPTPSQFYLNSRPTGQWSLPMMSVWMVASAMRSRKQSEATK